MHYDDLLRTLTTTLQSTYDVIKELQMSMKCKRQSTLSSEQIKHRTVETGPIREEVK